MAICGDEDGDRWLDFERILCCAGGFATISATSGGGMVGGW